MIYVSLCNHLGTGGRLGVCIRRSEDAQLRLAGVFCAYKVRPVSWESDFIFKLFLSFLLIVDLD